MPIGRPVQTLYRCTLLERRFGGTVLKRYRVSCSVSFVFYHSRVMLDMECGIKLRGRYSVVVIWIFAFLLTLEAYIRWRLCNYPHWSYRRASAYARVRIRRSRLSCVWETCDPERGYLCLSVCIYAQVPTLMIRGLFARSSSMIRREVLTSELPRLRVEPRCLGTQVDSHIGMEICFDTIGWFSSRSFRAHFFTEPCSI